MTAPFSCSARHLYWSKQTVFLPVPEHDVLHSRQPLLSSRLRCSRTFPGRSISGKMVGSGDLRCRSRSIFSFTTVRGLVCMGACRAAGHADPERAIADHCGHTLTATHKLNLPISSRCWRC